MTDLEKKRKEVEKKVTALIKTAKWQRSIKRSDKQVNEAIEKLRKASEVDPRLLDEPATR